MQSRSSLHARILVPLAAVVVSIDTVLFAVAVVGLQSGPSASAYGLLEAAVLLSILAALVVSAAAFAMALIRTKLVRTLGFAMLLVSALTATAALTLVTLGKSLSSIDPLSQPPALNSLLLALWGVGQGVSMVPVILAVGAVAVWLAPSLRGLGGRRSAVAVPT